MDVLEEYTRLDRVVKEADRSLHSLEAKREAYQAREKEIYEVAGVSGYDELKGNLERIKEEVGAKLVEWESRVGKVNEVIRAAEERVGAR